MKTAVFLSFIGRCWLKKFMDAIGCCRAYTEMFQVNRELGV